MPAAMRLGLSEYKSEAPLRRAVGHGIQHQPLGCYRGCKLKPTINDLRDVVDRRQVTLVKPGLNKDAQRKIGVKGGSHRKALRCHMTNF
jgi:hypothetical protein